MKQLLVQSVIHANEPVVQVVKEDSKLVTSEPRMCHNASGEYIRNHIRIFEYQSDCSESFLKGITGCLEMRYNQVQVIHCGF